MLAVSYRQLLTASNFKQLSLKSLATLASQQKLNESERNLRPKSPKLVIFDKDGTLICFHSMWVPWALEVSNRVSKLTSIDLSKEIFKELGVCPVKKQVKPGLLAEGTMMQINDMLTRLVVSSTGFATEKARQLVDHCTVGGDTATRNEVQTIGDIRQMFQKLQELNAKIAVCTMDKRDNTLHTIEMLKLEQYIDYIYCCDDKEFVPKPHPYNVLKICRELKVDPNDAIMIGDTQADINMALSAGMGAAVGVLSGVGCSEHLAKADVLIDKASDILHIFYDQQQQ